MRVYYEDTDAGGVVYYANYLRFLERARTELLRALGVDQQRLRTDEGVVFAVRSAQVDFHKPAHLDDALSVTANVTNCRRASLMFEQKIFRTGTTSLLLCSAEIRVACLQAESLKPHPIPDYLLQELHSGH